MCTRRIDVTSFECENRFLQFTAFGECNGTHTPQWTADNERTFLTIFLESLQHFGAGQGEFDSTEIRKLFIYFSSNSHEIIVFDFGKMKENENLTFVFLCLLQRHESDMPPYFKFLTIMAYYVFLKEKVDVAVVEVGIGGEYDCTNVIR